MTYCVAINLNEGLVFASDSRTNAGLDHVSVYSKMHSFAWPGDRVFVLLSAGNLATTQSVVKRLKTDTQIVGTSLLSTPNMTAAADYVGAVSAEVQRQQGNRDALNTNFEATFLLGGQIGSAPPELFMIYPQGNYIHESYEHPFLQVGETKYGKPILDRVIQRATPLEQAARCALVSLNSTLRSNLTVGPPLELLIYRRDSLLEGQRLYLVEEDPYYREMAERWNEGLLAALGNLPKFAWEKNLS